MKYSFLDSLGTTFVVIFIVFVLIIFLIYIIKFQSFSLNFLGRKVQIEKVAIVEEEGQEDRPQNDLEVVAAIAATLSSYLDVPQSNLNIKSIKRVNSKGDIEHH
jgi:Na+-transporting methylmalonyl-CoA/oxaloacetate decarboxylase gamma subunit